MKTDRRASILGALLLGLTVVAGRSDAEPVGVPRLSMKTSGIGSVEFTYTNFATLGGVGSTKVVDEMRNSLAKGDVDAVAQLLTTSDDIDALAKGIRFDSSGRDVVLERSDDRNTDPDVVAIKGIAQSALRGGAVKKLAAVMVLSTNHKGVPLLEAGLVETLSDRELMEALVEADVNQAKNPILLMEHACSQLSFRERSQATLCFHKSAVEKVLRKFTVFCQDPADLCQKARHGGGGSHLADLLAGKGVDSNCRRNAIRSHHSGTSFYCEHCWPHDICDQFFWCKTKI